MRKKRGGSLRSYRRNRSLRKRSIKRSIKRRRNIRIKRSRSRSKSSFKSRQNRRRFRKSNKKIYVGGGDEDEEVEGVGGEVGKEQPNFNTMTGDEQILYNFKRDTGAGTRLAEMTFDFNFGQ